MDGEQRRLYEFGPFRLDSAEDLLLRNGQRVYLTPKDLELLRLLVENHGRIMKKEELMRRVWPDAFVEEGNLNRHVSTIRKALGERRGENRYIETVQRRGYRFVAHVTEVRGEAAAPGGRPPGGAAAQAVAAGTPQKVLAVLPFRSIGRVSDDEHLGLRLADAVITRLSKEGRVAVRPTSTVRKYASGTHELTAVCGALGADLVLEGNIQKYGQRLRVTMQLINVAEGSTLWAEKLDEKCNNVFALEDSISECVSRVLPLKSAGERPPPRGR